MPDISYEALAGAALLVVLAVGYQYIPKGALQPGSTPSSGGSSKNKKKNNNKKKKGSATASGNGVGGIPGGAHGSGGLSESDEGASTSKTDASQSTAVGKSKNKGKGQSAPASASASGTPSFAAVASEPNGSEEGQLAPGQEKKQQQVQKPKTLAEKIAPKARKTKVDDMLAPEDRPPTHARVMKISKPSSGAGSGSERDSTPRPASPLQRAPSSSGAGGSGIAAVAGDGIGKIAKYEDDYQEDDDAGTATTTTTTSTTEDDGWDVVSRKKPISLKAAAPSDPFAGQTTWNPVTSTSTPIETKIQRKNAKKNEAKKAQKDAEEADRQARLAQHKKQLERERINEIARSNAKKGASGKTNGGAFASLDTNGKLVWD